MSVVVIGLNHRTAPLDLLERTTVDDSRLPKILHDLCARQHLHPDRTVISVAGPDRQPAGS